MRIILVFGVFDGIHGGHEFFLRNARIHGDRLTAAVAPDDIVRKLKNRETRLSETDRIAALSASGLVDHAVIGDRELSSWGVIHSIKPTIIALGYDQDALARAVAVALPSFPFPLEIVRIPGYRPDELHSSILNA
jgi:cytidyltransferase-like protein